MLYKTRDAMQPEHTRCCIKMAARIPFTVLVAACTLQVLVAFQLPTMHDILVKIGLAEDTTSSDDVLSKLDKLSEEAQAGVKDFAADMQKKFNGKCLSDLVRDLEPLVEEAVSKAAQCVKDVRDDIQKNDMKDLPDDIRKAEMCGGAAIQGFAMKAEPLFKAAKKCEQGA